MFKISCVDARATTGSFHGDSKTGPLVGALTCPDSATLLSECRAEAIPACDYYQTAGIIYGKCNVHSNQHDISIYNLSGKIITDFGVQCKPTNYHSPQCAAQQGVEN